MSEPLGSFPSPMPWTIRGRDIVAANGQVVAELQGPAGIAAANAMLLIELSRALSPNESEEAA